MPCPFPGTTASPVIPAQAGMMSSGSGRPSSNSAMTLHGGSLVERELDLPVVLGRRVIAESPLCHSREGGNTVGASGDELDPRLCGDDVEWVGKAEFQLGHGVARTFAGRAGARTSRVCGFDCGEVGRVRTAPDPVYAGE